ncbi:hypothetical protein BKH46_07840 [Helicobacter sp. 12S02634-8]|uniref:methyltransferase regulatory domain-containing protein n=1 Tax=Helicobacter sp. 12S02634-8 TaxID=1476199 RepID=UPI000BA53730|nr:methyltransferase regulatory domain-containing protein [Helicobacter sp. 12S02634-8]PAF46371.1 hypothetical protein BKH46_07840 [Helicobacter sp. 12S02634-8]
MDKNRYITDIDYTYGYYKETSPLVFKFICLLKGIKPLKIQAACELGYGNGISVNVHASASDTLWWGTDFNVSHAHFAQDLAAASGNGACLYADSFADFVHRTDLPDFDFIALHGIYSWVDKGNRDLLLQFINKKLKVGGGVYASYNVYPGFVQLAPFRNLLKNVSDYLSPNTQSSLDKLRLGLEIFDKLDKVGTGFIESNPHLKKRVANLKKMDNIYLAHEFINDTWELMDFMDIARSFEAARLGFVSSANFIALLENIIYTDEQKELMGIVGNIFFKEYIKDFIHNTNFRKDYWIKGAQRLSTQECQKQISAIAVILIASKGDIKYSIETGFGTINLDKEFYEPLVEILSDHTPKTITHIFESFKGKKSIGEIIEGVVVLTMLGHLEEAQDPSIAQTSLHKAHQFNLEILEKAKNGPQISVLASALLGRGIAIDRMDQLFLLSRLQGKNNAKDYADDAYAILEEQNQRLIKDGKVLESKEENIKELQSRAVVFEGKLKLFESLKLFKKL